MKLMDFIKETGSRVEADSFNWLFFDESTKEWVVCMRKAYSRFTEIWYRGEDEERAVQTLMEKSGAKV